MSDQRGFTLIELVMAMAVFSFMLLIILEGFNQIIELHNGVIESNAAQDNARSAIDTIVSDIRGATQISNPSGAALPVTSNTLCLVTASGEQYFAVVTSGSPSTKILYESNICGSIPAGSTALTAPSVQVANFQVTLETGGPSVTEPELSVTLTVASNDNTTFGTGAATKCNNNEQDREFCSVVTLTSGAVQR